MNQGFGTFLAFAYLLLAGCASDSAPAPTVVIPHGSPTPRSASSTNRSTDSFGPIPLKKGTQWIYESKVAWTTGTSQLRSKNVHWVMESVETISSNAVEVAVIRGFVDELAWYEPPREPGFSLLIAMNDRIYHMEAENEVNARNIARSIVQNPGTITLPTEPWLILPLKKRAHWGSDPPRDDYMYAWYVKDETPRRVSIAGVPSKGARSVWQLTYRTNPDHQIMEIVSGVGITKYVYNHHGTPASTDVRLVATKFPKP